MALVIPVGFAEVALQLRHTSDPDPWYVTYGVDVSGFGGDYDAVGTLIATYWEPFISDLLSNDVSCTGIKLTVGQDGGSPLIVFVPEDIPGTSTAARLPQNCALLIDKSTNLGGRKGRGRFFVPGLLAEGMVNSVGVIDGTYLAGIQAATTELLSAHNDGVDPLEPVPMVLLHNDYGSSTPPPTPIVRLTAQNLISTQRRRLR